MQDLLPFLRGVFGSLGLVNAVLATVLVAIFAISLAFEVLEENNQRANVNQVRDGIALGESTIVEDDVDPLRHHRHKLDQLRVGNKLLQSQGDADVENSVFTKVTSM